MSIEIRPLDDPDQWNDLVKRSNQSTAFHLAEALSVLADESNTTLDLLVGYKGEEPCGIFPAFSKQVGPFSVVFSPPPNLKVSYLGPSLITPAGMKQRRRELRHSRFIDAAVEWLRDERGYVFATGRTAPGYNDVRPFLWNEFEATPRYTYVVDITRDPDDLLAAFSTDARRNVTADYDIDFTIEKGGPDEIQTILTNVDARHAEQNEPFPIDGAFVTRLYEALPDGVVRPIVCRTNGQFVGGQVVLELGTQSIAWFGIADYDIDLPVTDLLDWDYITTAPERGVETYDLAGANKRRLSRYKSKFASELVPYYQIDDGNTASRIAATLYNKLP